MGSQTSIARSAEDTLVPQIAKLIKANDDRVEIVNLAGNGRVRFKPLHSSLVLAKAVKFGNTIKHLSLAACDLDDPVMGVFFDMLTVNQSLQELNLESNKITSLGAALLAPPLWSHRGMTELFLADQQAPFFNKSCICEFAEMLSVNTLLTKLTWHGEEDLPFNFSVALQRNCKIANGYSVGDEVEYYSFQEEKWHETFIIAVRGPPSKQEVQVDYRRGDWKSPHQIALQIRLHGAGVMETWIPPLKVDDPVDYFSAEYGMWLESSVSGVEGTYKQMTIWTKVRPITAVRPIDYATKIRRRHPACSAAPDTGLHFAGSRSIANLVINALSHQGWECIESSDVKVQEVSGLGGSKTFKIEAPSAAPKAVFLHLRRKDLADDPVTEHRMAAAEKEFELAGLGPRRLAAGANWFIQEAIEGTQCSMSHFDGPLSGAATQEGLAQLLAKIHSIPINWFNTWREKTIALYPDLLDNAPVWCNTWWISTRPEFVRHWVSSHKRMVKVIRMFQSDAAWLGSGIARRAVTTHGDFHLLNVLRFGENLHVIDFEYSVVSSAAFDIAYAFSMWLKTPSDRRAFVKAYLEALSEPASSGDVDALVLDAAFTRLTLFHPVGAVALLLQGICERHRGALEAYHGVQALLKILRGSANLCSEAVGLGDRIYEVTSRLIAYLK